VNASECTLHIITQHPDGWYTLLLLLLLLLYDDDFVVHVQMYNDQKLFERGWCFMNMAHAGIDPTNERQQNGERYSVTLFERQARAVRTSASRRRTSSYKNTVRYSVFIIRLKDELRIKYKRNIRLQIFYLPQYFIVINVSIKHNNIIWHE